MIRFSERFNINWGSPEDARGDSILCLIVLLGLLFHLLLRFLGSGVVGDIPTAQSVAASQTKESGDCPAADSNTFYYVASKGAPVKIILTESTD